MLRLTGHAALLFLAGLVVFAIIFAASGWGSFGAAPAGARQIRIEASPQWHDGRFENRQKKWIDTAGAYRRALFGPGAAAQIPDGKIPVAPVTKTAFDISPSTGLRATWFGHSSALVEIDGKRVLVDPVWSERVSPVGWAGPERWFAPPLAIADLPHIDAVLISHDHYDHLDRVTVQALAAKGPTFIVPLGIGAHLSEWGVLPAHIVELDWWENSQLGPVTITATPARHSSGRISTSSNRTLWAGYALVGPKHRVWYSGDTGFDSDFTRIGHELGPFDLTLIEAGQYDPAWPDNHLGPEMAVEAHRQVRGKLMLPVHWSLFSLAPHGWTEPIERVLVAARCQGVQVAAPRPWESFEPPTIKAPARWWPSLAWRSAEQKPVLSTIDGEASRRFQIGSCTAHGRQKAPKVN
ncbi:MBL fold metallo-hydrolase [Sphingopyxis panaciterrae]